jgi:hypothetical protein
MRSGRIRVGLGLIDQVLSGASNVLVIFAVARLSSIDDFGAISLAMIATSTLVATGRGLLGTPISLLSDDHEGLREETTFALSSGLLAGVVAGILMAIGSTLAPAPGAVLVVACATPIVMLQDLGRYHCIAVGRPTLAVLSDGIWAFGSVVLFSATIFASGFLRAWQLLFGWACLALIGALAVLLPLRLFPATVGILDWWRRTLHGRFRFGIEAGIAASSSLAVLASSSAILGVTAVAALRAAGAVFGPLSVLLSTIPLAVIPELRRRRPTSAVELWRPLKSIAWLLSVTSVVMGVTACLIPSAWGKLLLGESWRVARPLMPVVATEYAALAWLTVLAAALITEGRAVDLLKVRLLLSGMSLCGAIMAAAVFSSAMAVAIALAASSATVALWGRRVLASA